RWLPAWPSFASSKRRPPSICSPLARQGSSTGSSPPSGRGTFRRPAGRSDRCGESSSPRSPSALSPRLWTATSYASATSSMHASHEAYSLLPPPSRPASSPRLTRRGTSMKRSIASGTPCVRFRELLLLGLLFLAACAPARPPSGGPDIREEPSVSVGLLVDTTSVERGSTTEYELLDAAGQVLQRLGPREQVQVDAGQAGELIVTVGDQREVVGGTLIVRPSERAFVSIGGKLYRGTALVRAAAPGRLTAINQVGMEEYLLGVVPFEIGRVGPELLEAAKAQAVAARTYALRYLGRRAELGFDVFATVEDQVYGGAEGEHEPVSEAVLATAGEILTYRGEPIEAFYHSTCAGQTAAIEEVWPQEAPRPYLISV